ncbi:MAG: TetR/AcrR family transcriptional regulator [Clostridioides difficile]|nr:TetR/AcrR family transcriptional regulator [Clostridioides difficile]
MARGLKVFTGEDKNRIKSNLIDICKELWISQGYKETSIKELSSRVGISTGAFYNLYSSKENLFFETLCEVQISINQKFMNAISQNSTKQGFLHAVNELYFEYNNKPFLYNTKTPDFLLLYNKLTQEQIKTLEAYNVELFRESIQKADLKLKIDENLAFSVFSLLFSTIASKDDLSKSGDYNGAFLFIINRIVDDIFE